MNIYKQRGKSDCMLACIAMAVQKDYDQLWSTEFREQLERLKGCYGDNVEKAMNIAGLTKDVDYWTTYVEYIAPDHNFRRLLYGRRAILQVPSLNYQKTQHSIYWTGEALHDPSTKQVYQWLEQCAPVYVWLFNEMQPQPQAD